MITLVGSWIMANLAIVGLLGLGWVTATGAVAAGVLALGVFTAFLVRSAAMEMEASARGGPLERRASTGRVPRRPGRGRGAPARPSMGEQAP